MLEALHSSLSLAHDQSSQATLSKRNRSIHASPSRNQESAFSGLSFTVRNARSRYNCESPLATSVMPSKPAAMLPIIVGDPSPSGIVSMPLDSLQA